MPLRKFKARLHKAPRTLFADYARVITLTVLNIRYERIAFSKNLPRHPYILTRQLIEDAEKQFLSFMECAFIENKAEAIQVSKSQKLEEKHQQLWQNIWPRHTQVEFEGFIDLKARRLRRNKLEPLIAQKKCVEVGCGNGAFCFALHALGAHQVTGIDFGQASIEYAKKMAKEYGLSDKLSFRIADVVATNLPSQRFDFAVSNGVFHHLKKENIEPAIQEIARILKPGGWFWYYVDGKNAISMDLWDTSVEILKAVPTSFIEQILTSLNINREKMVFIMDGLSATYIHSSLSEVSAMLKRCGFINLRRLVGGTPTDFDANVIAKHPYGKEKFGEGDLRILAQLAPK